MALDATLRNACRAGGFFNRHAEHETQLNNLRAHGRKYGECCQAAIQIGHIHKRRCFPTRPGCQQRREMSLGGHGLAGLIHKDLPHHPRSNGQQMPFILCIGKVAADKAHCGFVGQFGGLQCATQRIPAQNTPRHSPHFAVTAGMHVSRDRPKTARRAFLSRHAPATQHSGSIAAIGVSCNRQRNWGGLQYPPTTPPRVIGEFFSGVRDRYLRLAPQSRANQAKARDHQRPVGGFGNAIERANTWGELGPRRAVKGDLWGKIIA